MTARTRKPPLWTCPQCGHRFVTRNLWHSCGNYALDDHFKGKDPIVRQIFNKFVALAKRSGPVTVYAQKTRIVMMVRMRFAGGRTAKQWFDAGMILPRKSEHPALHKYQFIPPRYHAHYFRLRKLADVDAGLAKLMRQAYAMGCQEEVHKGRDASGRPRRP